MQGFYELKPDELTGIEPAKYAVDHRISLDEALKRIAQAEADWRSGVERIFVNDTHMVYARPVGVEGWHLSIKRRDREPIFSWRELQDVKNALVDPEREAIELFPAEERLVDQSNQFHIWVNKNERIDVGWDGKWLNEVIGTKPSWRNDTYRVRVEWIPGMFHLIIRRRDGKDIHDWRDLQWIKNEVIGIDHEGFELYPSEGRVIEGPDTHLWVYADMRYRIPVGFTKRDVIDYEVDGSFKQRGMERMALLEA